MLFEVIPREVIFNHVLPFLDTTEVIRLREVCKEAKLISCDYLRENSAAVPVEVELNETNSTIFNFLLNGIPYSRIYINNGISESLFFENEHIDTFLSIYGKRIKHLRISVFALCLSEKERTFFKQLSNLESLEIEYLKLNQSKKALKDVNLASKFEVVTQLCDYTVIFENLKKLQFSLKEDNFNKETFICSLIFPQNCKALVSYGTTIWCDKARLLSMEFGNMLNQMLEFLISQLPMLKKFDLCCWNQVDAQLIRENADEVNNFLAKLVEKDVHLYNVNSSFLEVVNPFENPVPNICSLLNVHPFVQIMQMTLLQEISVVSSQSSTNIKMIRLDFDSFKNLKKIEVLVDSFEMLTTSWFEDGAVYVYNEKHLTKHLVEFLFRSCIRFNVRELEIGYDANVLKSRQADGLDIPMPKIVELSLFLPNISKLTLNQWPGTNRGISKIWIRLLHLEEVCIDHCTSLGNVAFVGTNVEEPICLSAKKLRKLELKGLDAMPKLTNTLFATVIRHVSLTQFVITSDGAIPKTQVTPEGVLYLNSGIFGKTIEYFPFYGWSFEEVSNEKFIEISRCFRSTFM